MSRHAPEAPPPAAIAASVNPLVPAEVDLRGLPFMPLDVQRLRDSGLAIEATGDEFRAAILLWCACWNQVPAASLPEDDKTLAAYAGYGRDLKGWRKVKPGALRGFVQCSDGRIYHPVVAEKALQAWEERLEYRDKRDNEAERLRRHREEHQQLRAELRGYGVTAAWNEKTETLRERVEQERLQRTRTEPETRTGALPATAKKGQGQGQGQGEGEGRDSLKASPTNNTSADNSLGPAAALARVLRKMGWSECADGHPELVAAAASGITEAQIQAAAVGKSGKPIAYLVKRAKGMVSDAAPVTIGNVVPIKTVEQEEAATLAQLRRELEDKIHMASNDQVLGIIDEQTRDERIANYRDALRELSTVPVAPSEARS